VQIYQKTGKATNFSKKIAIFTLHFYAVSGHRTD
jgi:hypothetical protein